MISNAYIPMDDIILDVTQELGVTGLKRLGMPWVIASIKRAVKQMAHETGFDVRQWDAVIPSDLRVEVPCGMIGGEGIWLYNGSNCSIQRSENLWIKENMYHKGGTGYFANNKWRNCDGLQEWSGPFLCPPNVLHFAGYYHGHLYLSESCRAFTHLHIAYNGMGAEKWGDDVEIPAWASEAITDWVIRAGARLMRRDNQDYIRVAQEKDAEIKGVNGSWLNAKVLYSRMDAKTRFDVAMYTSRFAHAS